jgi:hypothetical protein
MRRVTASILAATLLVAAAGAADRPISASKLQLKRSGTKESLTFVSKDRTFPFPAIGSPDDPQTAGAVLDVVPFPGTAVALALPPGTGKPGWTGKAGASSRLEFDNPLAPSGISPVRVALLRQGKQIKITARGLAGLSFAPATESMTIRLTTGSLRTCVRFGPSTIRRSDTTVFLAANAAADSLPDCSDESIGLPPGCATSTSPACGGACPSGESCNDVGNGCACLPDGATPCGSPGAPTCGGACPTGEVCRPIIDSPFTAPAVGCGCGAPTACSAGGVECTEGHAGQACGITPGGGRGCLPMFCGGGTCGGPCGDGGTCSPIFISGPGVSACACAVAAPCCDGGYVCPPSQYCELPTLNTCALCQSLP